MEIKLHTKNLRASHPRLADDYQLVQRSIAGSQQAYTVLYNRYHTALFIEMFRRVRNRDEAEELAQDALSKALLNLKSYTPTHGFSTWLFKIASNHCIDYIRRKKSSIPVVSGDAYTDSDYSALGISPGEASSPEELMIREERQQMVRTLLESLPDNFRTALELRFYDELSYDEIAREMNIPIGTVKALLHRAKDHLLQQMQKPFARAHLESTTRYAV